MTTPTTAMTVSDYMRQPQNLARFEELLGRDAMPYVQSVLIAVSANPDLMACTPNSIQRAALRSASLGLSLDPALKQAWLVPYPRKIKATRDSPEHWIQEAQFQPHYKGLYTLAVRTGKYRIINVGPIYEGQQVLENPQTGLHVVMDGGVATQPDVTNPAFSIHGAYDGWRNVTKRRDQGKKIIGWMAYFETLRGTKKSVYMSLEEIDEHARAHVKNYDRNPNWNDAGKRPTMEMKTVFRQLMGWADLSGTENLKLAEALKSDAGEPESIDGDVMDVTPEIPDQSVPVVTVTQSTDPVDVNQGTGEIIETMGEWAVGRGAKFWNISTAEAAKQIAQAKLGRMDKAEFIGWLEKF